MIMTMKTAIKKCIYALAYIYLLMTPATIAETAPALTINHIQFNIDDAENLLLLSQPSSPDNDNQNSAGKIAKLFRNIRGITNSQERIQQTAELLILLSEKYQLSTRPNWNDHVIAIHYPAQATASLHRISSGLDRKEFDILLKQLIEKPRPTRLLH